MESAGVRYLHTSKYRTKHFTCGILCLLYTYWDIHHFGGLFILNLSKMVKFAAHEITMKTKYQLFSRNVS